MRVLERRQPELEMDLVKSADRHLHLHVIVGAAPFGGRHGGRDSATAERRRKFALIIFWPHTNRAPEGSDARMSVAGWARAA